MEEKWEPERTFPIVQNSYIYGRSERIIFPTAMLYDVQGIFETRHSIYNWRLHSTDGWNDLQPELGTRQHFCFAPMSPCLFCKTSAPSDNMISTASTGTPLVSRQGGKGGNTCKNIGGLNLGPEKPFLIEITTQTSSFYLVAFFLESCLKVQRPFLKI